MRRLISLTAILTVWSGVALAAPQINDAEPGLGMRPDGSIPSGPFGNLGPAIPPPDAMPTARESAGPAPVKPADPPLSAADRRKRHLDELYARLAGAKDETEAQAISGMIKDELLRSGSDTADLLMQRALAALDAKNFPTATALLDKLVTLKPRWAEAWNQRATVRFLDDDDVGAMADIGQVLALEPRHFGALSGMGFILHRNGDDKDALTVFRRALAIDPQDGSIKTLIDQLTPGVEGQEL